MRTGLLKFTDGLAEWRDMRFPERGFDPEPEGAEHIRVHVNFIIGEIHKLRALVNTYWGENGIGE